MDTKPHIGRKITRIRELRGMKQEALAQALGISQQTVSAMENSEELDDKRLDDVAKALGVTKEALRNFSEEAVINYFNNFYDNSSGGNTIGAFGTMTCNFNPLDKVVELYERLVKAERERADAWEKMAEK